LRWSGGGIVLIGAGVLLLLRSSGFLSLETTLWAFWPLLLIGFGLFLLFGRGAAPDDGEGRSGMEGTMTRFLGRISATVNAETLRYATLFGDLRLTVTSPVLRGGSLSTIVGGSTLDLRSARAADGENRIRINGVIGSVKVRVPADMALGFYGSTLLGAIRAGGDEKEGFFPVLDVRTPGYERAAGRLRIDAALVVGSIVLQKDGE
jgi:lia operon protein LiaF